MATKANPEEPKFKDYLPQTMPDVPARFRLRPEHYRPRYWQDQALTYWENPQRVARYHQVQKAQPPGAPPKPWLDHETLGSAYEAIRDHNKNEMWWNWKPLPYDHPLSPALRGMEPPPLPMLTLMGEEKYYQPTEAEELPSPAQAGMTDADWDKLPRWQRFLAAALQSPIFAGGMGALAGVPIGAAIAGPWGAVGGGVLAAGASIYAQKNPESTAASMLLYLDLPAEWLEQASGLATQIGFSITEPEKYGEIPWGDWDELLDWLGAARKAGTLAYSGGGQRFDYPQLPEFVMKGLMMPWGGAQAPVNMDILNLIVQADIAMDPLLDLIPGWETPEGLEQVSQPGEVWKFGQPLPEAIDTNITEAMLDARTRILQGEQPEQVIAEYVEMYGATGQFRELVGHIVVDPLNVIPFAAGKAGSFTAAKMGNVELATAFATTFGVTEAAQKYGTILRATKPITELSEAGAVTRWLTGVTKAGEVKIMAPASEGGGLFKYLLNMKPSSRATEVVNTSAVNLAAVLAATDGTPDELVRIVKMLANTPDEVARELSMRSINAPDAAAIPMFLKDFGETADEALLKWQATGVQRKMLKSITEVTGKSDTEVLQMIANATDAEVLLKQFVDAARAEKGSGADALVRAYEDARKAVQELPPEQQLTAESIQDLVKVFIEDELPHNEDMFRAQLYAAAMDKGADWAADWFGVKPDPAWVRTSQMIKSAQSLLLLGLNPTYFVNNALNNTLTSAATGIFGIRSAKTIDTIWARAGIEPPRLRAGVGPISLGEELNYQAIRAAMDAPGSLANVTRFFNEKTRKIQIFSNLSMSAEKMASAQAYTAGFVQYMGRHWREGVGFHRMPAPLERALSQVHEDLPRMVYAAIKGGMNQAEIEQALWSGLSRRSVDGALPVLVERLKADGVKLSEADIKEILVHSGVDDLLRDKLKDAKTDADVNAVFDEANKIVQDRLDKAVAQDLERTAAEVAGRVSGGEGLPAVLELFDHQQLEFTERWFENFAEWEKAFNDTQNMDYNGRKAVMQATAANQRQKWNRYYTSERAKFQGMVKGLGLDGSDNRKMLDLVDGSQKNHKDFFEYRDKANKKFFNNKFDSSQERKLAWDVLQEELLEAYNGMTSKELKIQDDMDEMLIGYLVGKFGPEAGEAGNKWRVGVGEIRKNMIDEMRAMRGALRTMPVDERRVAWMKFLHGSEGYLEQIGELFRKNVDGAHEMYNNLRGRGGEAPEGAPKPSGEPPPSGAKPEAVPVDEGVSVPFMLTYAMKRQLRDLGYSPDDIAKMTPDDAWKVINEKKVADEAWGQVQTPEKPPTPQAPEPSTPGIAQDLSPVGRVVTVKHRGQAFQGTVVDEVKTFGDGSIQVRIQREGDAGSIWYPLDAVEGINGRGQPAVEIPTVQPPTSNAVFAENARIAAEAGIPLVDEAGNIVSGGEIHLMNAIRKYGGSEAMQYNRVKEVPTEIVQRALDERAKVKAAEAEKWGAALETELEELGGVTPTEGEVHPIDQAIIDNRLDDLPDDVRLDVEQSYGEMAAEVEAAEKGFRIFTEAAEGGGPDVTGVKSTYPDWWSDLKNPFYKDAEGKKYTAKAAVVKVLQDLHEGKVNPKNTKGDNYVLVERAKGQVLGYLQDKRAYQIATGVVDTTKQSRKLVEVGSSIKDVWVWDNPKRLQSQLDDVNNVIAELMDYNYEDIGITVDRALDLQETIMGRLEELKRIPPEELTQMIDEAQRLARLELSDYESRTQVYDFQMEQGVPPSELFQKPKQGGFWEAGEDTPLFTGAAQKAQESVFRAQETPTQGQMPGFEVQMKGAKAGGEAAGPLFDAAAQAGLFRRNLRQKFVDYFLSEQPEVISGAWDAQTQADAFIALADARANVWAKHTGREAWEWYPHTFADVTPRKIDATNDVYLLGQIESNKGTPGYQAFADGNKVVDADGDLIVVYHGTTHEFRTFDPSQGEIGNFMGRAIYATDSIDDVNANYAGFGPDLTNRIESLSERISQDIGDGGDLHPYENEIMQYFGLTPEQLDHLVATDYERLVDMVDGDIDGLTEVIARKQIAGKTEGLVMPVYYRMENPAVLKRGGGTYLELGDVYRFDADWIIDNLQEYPQQYLDEIREFYGYAEDWDPDDLAAFIEDDLYTIADEIAVDPADTDYGRLEQALRYTFAEMEMSTNETTESILAKIGEDHFDGGYLDEIIDTIKNRTDMAYADDLDTGDLVANEFIGRLLKNMGYDGAIMDAGVAFPRMDGTYGAKHYIAWEPTQVKSVFNMGDFDPTNPDIYYQRGFQSSPAWAGDEAQGVSVVFSKATERSAGLFDETVVPILESNGGAYAIAEDPVGGYVLDSIFSGKQKFDTLHEARRAAWEEAFTRARNTGDLMFQEVDPSPRWYYSPLKKLMQDKMPGRIEPDQLRNLIRKGGVKADEMKWTGLDDWLSERELSTALARKGKIVELEEGVWRVVDGDGSPSQIIPDFPGDDSPDLYTFKTQAEAQKFINEWSHMTKDQVLEFLDRYEVHVEEVAKGEPKPFSEALTKQIDEIQTAYTKHRTEVYEPAVGDLADAIYKWAEEDGQTNATQAYEAAKQYSLAGDADPLVADWVLDYVRKDPEYQGLLQRVEQAGKDHLEYQETIRNLDAERTPVKTQYDQYTLHGAARADRQNYRELLLQWNQPEKISSTRGVRLDTYDYLPWETSRGGYADYYYDKEKFTLERALSDLERDLKAGSALDDTPSPSMAYRSGHWNEPNVLAHVRYSDYIDVDGKKVLYIDEIQSDWQQAARTQGTIEPPTINDAKVALVEGWRLWGLFEQADELLKEVATKVEDMALNREAVGEEWVVKRGVEFADREGTGRELGVFKTVEEAREFYYNEGRAQGAAAEGGLALYKREVRSPEYTKLQNDLMEARQVRAGAELDYNEFKNNTWYPLVDFDQGGVPPAPFAKTWQDLAMKRMLRYAAEKDYDRIAWSTGRIQNERWNLAQYYSKIEWAKNYQDDTMYHLSAFDPDGNHIKDMEVSASGLSDYVGDNIAKRIIDDPNPNGILEGAEDLAVGSRGMDFFYDQLIPKGMKKYGKKWGVEPGEALIFTGVPGFENTRVLDTTNEFVKVAWDNKTATWRVLQKNDHDNWIYITYPEFGEYVRGDTPERALANAQWDHIQIATGRDYTPVHGMDITPEMRSSVLQGQPLFSQKKGAVQFLKDGKAMIYALESPDVSTMVHELGHVFRMDLRKTIDLAADDVIKAQLMLDFETASRWAGAIEEDGEFLWSGEAAYKHGMDSDQYRAGVQAEEKFARGFEEYLQSGKAPTPELVGVFEQFKEWLAHIYARLRGDLAGVSPQMKEVYDRLLAEYPEAADYPITTEMGRAKMPSQGQMFQPAPSQNTENFGRWFGDSKVTENGQPQVVYHATKNEFIAFDPDRTRDFGFHFGTIEQAEGIAGMRVPRGPYEGANIQQTYLSIENPLRVKDFQWGGNGLRTLIDEHLPPIARERLNYLLQRDRDLFGVMVYIDRLRNGGDISSESRLILERLAKEFGTPLDKIISDRSQDGLIEYMKFKTWASIQRNGDPVIGQPGTVVTKGIRRLINEAIIDEFEALGYDGMVYKNKMEGAGDSWIAFQPEQVKSIRNAGEWSPTDPDMLHQSVPLEYENGYKTNLLFQDELPENTHPLGEVQSHNPSPPLGEIQEEGYRNHIYPVMNGLQDVLTGPGAKAPDRVANLDANLDPATMRQLKQYMGEVYGDLNDTKLTGVRWAENRRDAALLNYSRRYGFDNAITAIFPYQFWYTRTAMQWALRFIDKPAWLSQYARIRNFQRTTLQTPGFPMRMKDKMKMPVPYLPEWAGGGIYVDPFRQIFPFEQFARPYEQRAQDKNMMEKRAASTIQYWAEDGEEDPQAAQEALEFRSGPLWEKAISIAELDVESDTSNPWDFMNLIMSPSMPIDIASKWLRGDKDKISQTPAARMIQNVSGALGANQGRGWNIEGPIRRALDLPEQDAYHDYRVDRELSNLVAEGSITPEQANQAMVDQSGDTFLMAQQRAAKTQQMKFLGGPVGADLFPEGEQTQRALKIEYDRALEAKGAGQTDAVNQFFDKYPEYEARMLLFKEDPEERLRSFLRGSIWEAWLSDELPELHKKQIQEQLGDVFTQAFLNPSTRSYDSIDTPTLTQWARLLGGAVPESSPETPGAQVELAGEGETAAYQAFTEERDRKFPNIGKILNVMYEAPEDQMNEYKKRFPEVDDYYAWRNKQFADHPEILPYALSEQSKMAGAPQEAQALYYQYQVQRDQLFPGVFELQDEYFTLDKNAKKVFRQQNPMLPAYWEWRREFMRQYPNMIPYLMSEESLAEAVLGDERQYSSGGSTSQSSQPSIDINQLNPVLVRKLTAYYMFGEPLGTGARKNLRAFWESQGSPGEKLNEFIDEILKKEF